METPTKILFFALILVILGLSGCYYQTQAEEAKDGEQVSYIGEGLGEMPDTGEENGEAVTTEDTGEPEAVEAAPVSSPGEIAVYEGELVQLQVKGSDPDGDPVTYTFSQPLDENGKWQTELGDAGDYLVTVTASDGKTQTSKTLRVRVISKNTPPVMESIPAITIREGETVSLSPKVTDADGDQVSISYSGWMTSSSKTTGYNDAGTYSVKVTASDGKQEVSQNVGITVLDVNRAPTFEIVVS